MTVELLSLLAALLTSLGATILPTDIIWKYLRKLLGKKPPQKTYAERLSDLTSNLSKASIEVDGVLREMNLVAQEREKGVRDLEKGLAGLEKREKEIKERINILQSVPIPVAEHFARLVAPSERRSARRDYLLFISGVVVTTLIALVLQLAFGK